MLSAPRLRRREVPPFASGSWPALMHPVLQRVYAGRGIAGELDLGQRLAQLLAPESLGGLDVAVGLLIAAIRNHERIVVVGDFDCDGATGTAVAVRGLRMLGATHVDYRVPHRVRHGYGLSPGLVDELRVLAPQLLLTVDSGIACHAGVEAANAAGMRVIISDHHLPGASLPAAAAIVNPNLAGDGFPSKSLAGVGVVFYLLLALRRKLRETGWFEQQAMSEPDLAVLLDLVALGTVADMVPLDANNRILVSAGLRRMRAGQMQPGVRALLQLAGRVFDQLNAADLGFALGPRVNAAGRLEDMSLGIACLLSEHDDEARHLASELDAINQARKELQQQMLAQAETLVEDWISRNHQGLPNSLCVFNPDWHPGVVGLVASRLKERLHRPVIAFAPAGDGATLRGSARSIPGFHIRDALADVAAFEPGLLGRFGGHAMAAGLGLAEADFEAFRDAFERVAASRLDAAMLRAELWSDGPLQRSELGRELAQALRLAGPWGQGFPEPLFDDEFEVESWRVVAGRHLKLRLRHRDGGEPLDAIEFGGWDGKEPAARVHLAYQLELDDWRDRHGIQLLVRQRFSPAP